MLFQLWNRPSAATSRAARTRERLGEDLIDKLDGLHDGALRTGVVTESDLRMAYRKSLEQEQRNQMNPWYAIGILLFIMLATPVFFETIHFLLGVRCFLPNNYLVWEATRPISDCGFCSSVQGPLILQNLTREEFAPFAYSSQPIIIKNAVAHWPAAKNLNFTYLKDLYERTPGALDEDCQFLHFRSDFKSLKEVFLMSDQRAAFVEGHHPWYVGWSNCHPIVLEELRKLYPRPHFLPEDAEMPNTDYIFLGYEQGAFMHRPRDRNRRRRNNELCTQVPDSRSWSLQPCYTSKTGREKPCAPSPKNQTIGLSALDYIPRLMWQAQLQGNKSWILAPTPECDHLCHSFSFYVEPGDAVLVDTRIWYHGTSIPKGQFALTIQSEYG